VGLQDIPLFLWTDRHRSVCVCVCVCETDLSHMCTISPGHCEFALIAVFISGRGGQAKGLIRARFQTQNTYVRVCFPGQTRLIVNNPEFLCNSII